MAKTRGTGPDSHPHGPLPGCWVDRFFVLGRSPSYVYVFFFFFFGFFGPLVVFLFFFARPPGGRSYSIAVFHLDSIQGRIIYTGPVSQLWHGIFILGPIPAMRSVAPAAIAQRCTTACLSWDRPPAVQSVAPAAQPKTETTARGGQPKHPKRTTNKGDPKGRGRQPANTNLEPKWLRTSFLHS